MEHWGRRFSQRTSSAFAGGPLYECDSDENNAHGEGFARAEGLPIEQAAERHGDNRIDVIVRCDHGHGQVMHGVYKRAVSDDGAKHHQPGASPEAACRHVRWKAVSEKRGDGEHDSSGQLLNSAGDDWMGFAGLAPLHERTKTPQDATELKDEEAGEQPRVWRGVPATGGEQQHDTDGAYEDAAEGGEMQALAAHCRFDSDHPKRAGGDHERGDSAGNDLLRKDERASSAAEHDHTARRRTPELPAPGDYSAAQPGCKQHDCAGKQKPRANQEQGRERFKGDADCKVGGAPEKINCDQRNVCAEILPLTQCFRLASAIFLADETRPVN